ncbi:MAG: cation:proton antiporter [Ruminococcus sp.]|nr:cation:proton antiporter [Ruminococcus sp.]
MLISLAVIFLVGLFMADIFNLLKLPKIIGMLLTGILTGPFVLDLIDPSVLGISSELRRIALIIILIKAGLSLNLSDLKKVGRPAVMMSFVPACFEITGYIIFAPLLLGLTRSESAVMGAVLSAVSPAVVVPRMVNLIEEKTGTKKGIPQMILAGASCDDIFVIVLFSAFVTMEQGGTVNISDFLDIPVSMVTGVIIGIIAGFIVSMVFRIKTDPIIKTIIMLSVSFILMTAEDSLKKYIAVSGLLAVVAMACTVKIKGHSGGLSQKFGKLWIPSEIILFVLVGAAVDIRYTVTAGINAVIMIFVALLFRTVGVLLCTVKTNFSIKERIFCVIAYLPKATVQAAIGSVPLSLGLPCGKTILSVAVLAIIITAPLGAVGIDITKNRFLEKESGGKL